MSKLHELLAVEGNLENQAEKCRTELIGTTFANKRHHFTEKRVTFRSNTEGAAEITEEQSDIQTSVRAEIEWISAILAKAMDASHHIDLANTEARADVVTEDDEKTILKNVPSTSLLQLETTLQKVRLLAAAIPTLDPAKGFTQDPQRDPGVFKAREVTKARTKKTPRVMEMSPATKEHPAQVQLLQEDLPVGSILEQEWSSLITPVTKSEILERVDILLRAIKKARARANDLDVSVSENKIGKVLLDYIFKPLL